MSGLPHIVLLCTLFYLSPALQINPYYGKTSMSGLRAHFQALLKEGPAIIYNVPGRTGQDIPDVLVQEMAQHPNFLGMKECTGNKRIGNYTQQVSRGVIMLCAVLQPNPATAYKSGAHVGLAAEAGLSRCNVKFARHWPSNLQQSLGLQNCRIAGRISSLLTLTLRVLPAATSVAHPPGHQLLERQR
jgi:hypothetical protein